MQLDHEHQSGEGSLHLDPFLSNGPSPNPSPASAIRGDSFGSSRHPEPVSPSSRSRTPRHATTTVTAQAESPAAVPPTPGLRTIASPHPPGAGPDPDGIEMASVTPSGHRRRRSSLINPANPSGSSHRSPQPRSQSIRRPGDVDDEGKIPEESSDEDALRLDKVDEDGLSDEDLHDDEEAGLTGKDRRRKRRKRNRNQLLDQRIARDNSISQAEKKEADRSVAKNLLINGCLIGLWYFFSLLISLVWTQQLLSPPWANC